MNNPKQSDTIQPLTLKIENADYALTLDDDRRILTDAAIVIADGAITAIGKTDELANVPADEVI